MLVSTVFFLECILTVIFVDLMWKKNLNAQKRLGAMKEKYRLFLSEFYNSSTSRLVLSTILQFLIRLRFLIK